MSNKPRWRLVTTDDEIETVRPETWVYGEDKHEVLSLQIGEKYEDRDGDIWERIA